MVIVDKQGVEYRCYDLAEYRTLSHIIIDYNTLLDYASWSDQRMELYTRELDRFRLQLTDEQNKRVEIYTYLLGGGLVLSTLYGAISTVLLVYEYR